MPQTFFHSVRALIQTYTTQTPSWNTLEGAWLWSPCRTHAGRYRVGSVQKVWAVSGLVQPHTARFISSSRKQPLKFFNDRLPGAKRPEPPFKMMNTEQRHCLISKRKEHERKGCFAHIQTHHTCNNCDSPKHEISLLPFGFFSKEEGASSLGSPARGCAYIMNVWRKWCETKPQGPQNMLLENENCSKNAGWPEFSRRPVQAST